LIYPYRGAFLAFRLHYFKVDAESDCESSGALSRLAEHASEGGFRQRRKRRYARLQNQDINFQAEFERLIDQPAASGAPAPERIEVRSLTTRNDGNNVSLDREMRCSPRTASAFNSPRSCCGARFGR